MLIWRADHSRGRDLEVDGSTFGSRITVAESIRGGKNERDLLTIVTPNTLPKDAWGK